MKTLLKGLINQHIIPIILAIIVLIGADWILSNKFHKSNVENSNPNIIVVKGVAMSLRNSFENCTSKQAEIELIHALQKVDKLIIMGSSELQSLAYSPYYFLPDSAGIPTIAFGHAYHQNLSIACELLAAGDQLNGANVCILLSPGWFETGTNVEAFLEFVRPNFLRRIIHDTSIPEEEKMRIAKFIYTHFNEINNPSIELMYFKEMYLKKLLFNFPKSFTLSNSLIKKVTYNISSDYDWSSLKRNPSFDVLKTKKQLENTFLKTCSNNTIFVDSNYYTSYLAKGGKYTSGYFSSFTNREELEDFFMVVDILKRHNCNATFVLQPLNPYHYKGLENFNWVKKEIIKKLNEANFPLLDKYVTSPKEYDVLFLKDIMHPGDRGWMEVNEFLIKNYSHVQK